ncbi:MAG: J domain-containing protein [Pseudomonadota bacterium]|nr:J domain-containing protein [Pseudomonadota bacterium]
MEVIREWMRDRLAVGKRLPSALRRPRQDASGKGAVACETVLRRQPLARLNHYALLGVGEDATASEIRSAYLRLMKERHPDREGHVSTPTGSAAEINSAYWVLRDPTRRMRYDEALREEEREWIYPLVPLRAATPPGKSTRPLELAGAGALLAVMIGLVLIGQRELDERGKSWAGAVPFPQSASDLIDGKAPQPSQAAAVNESSIAEAAATATRIPSDKAAEHSRQCFEELAASPGLRLLDYCLAFDVSVGVWHPDLAPSGIERGYFTPLTQEARHAEALSRFFKTKQEAHERSLAIAGSSVTQVAQELQELLAGRGSAAAEPRCSQTTSRRSPPGCR